MYDRNRLSLLCLQLPSDSGSNPESDSAEDHGKEFFKAESRLPIDANRSAAFLNLQIPKHLGVPATNSLHHHGNLRAPLTFATAGNKSIFYIQYISKGCLVKFQ